MKTPSGDADFGEAQGRFLIWMEGNDWGEAMQMLASHRKSEPIEQGALIDAVQALIIEVGRNHGFRTELHDILSPDTASIEDTISAALYLAGSGGGRAAAEAEELDSITAGPAPALSHDKLVLVLQSVLAEVAVVPAELGLKDFMATCDVVASRVVEAMGE